jgi:hypothetical protein
MFHLFMLAKQMCCWVARGQASLSMWFLLWKWKKWLSQVNVCTLLSFAFNVDSDANTSDVPGLEQLLQEFSDVLSGLLEGLPPTRAGDPHIRLELGTTPPASRIYPWSGAQLAELRAQLQELLEKGFVRPSTSPYGDTHLICSQKGWRLASVYGLHSLIKSQSGTNTPFYVYMKCLNNYMGVVSSLHWILLLDITKLGCVRIV